MQIVSELLEAQRRKVSGDKNKDVWGDLVVNVKLFGADNNGEEDCSDALQAARDHIASLAQPCTLLFPAGIYKYSVSPNWAIQDVKIAASGEVRLRYTGTENAVIIDGGPYPAGGVTNMEFGQFIVEAPATAKHGCYVRTVHHSTISLKVQGCGSGYAGLKTEFTVCNVYNLIVSNNEGGWYQGAKPHIGFWAGKRNTGELTSYCTFINPVLEGVDIGAYLEDAIGNSFFGGTMEGCSQVGCQIVANGSHNRLFNVDFEVNGASDINCNGHNNAFIGCDSDTVSILDINSYQNQILGGNYTQINIAAGATANQLLGVKYNRFGTSKTISDNGTKTRLTDNYNIGLARFENRPPDRSTISATGSPFTYTNNSGNNEKIMISGGTVSQTVYIHGGVGDVAPTPLGMYTLAPTDALVITYTGAPLITKYSS